TGDADDVAFVGLRAQLGELAAQTGDDEDGGFDGAAYFREVSCPACEGTGLRIEARMVKVAGRSIADLSAMPLSELRAFLEEATWSAGTSEIAEVVLEQVRRR